MNKFAFTVDEESDLKRYLHAEIERFLKKQELADSAYVESIKKQMYGQILFFIKNLETDVESLRIAGRYNYPLAQFAANVAGLFDTLLGIEVTPTRNNNFSKILQTCFYAAGAIEKHSDDYSDVYIYAKAGIDQIKTEQNPYRVINLLDNEKKVGGGEFHSKPKKLNVRKKKPKGGVV